MTCKKVLMACSNYWSSPFQVGSHHIARGFVKEGWKVAYISDPISPFHFMGKYSQALQDRFYIYLSGGKYYFDWKLWTYVPGASFTPYNKTFLKSNWVLRNWQKSTFPNVVKKVGRNGFREVDLLYLDSVNQSFWLRAIKYKKSIFRLADNNSGFDKFTPAAKILERELANAVDLVIYTALSLKDYVEELKPKSLLHVPNGVNFNHFFKGSRDLPPEYKNIQKPIAIYVGAMDYWFDFDLVNQTAKRLPHVSFVLIGPHKIAKKKLKKLHNIHILGSRSYSQLPSYLYNSDVGIIPFNVSSYPTLVNNINPLKLFEYMSCGLPVVAVEWEELNNLNSPAILCQSAEEFIESIFNVLLKPLPTDTYVNLAAKEDWSLRIKTLCEFIEKI